MTKQKKLIVIGVAASLLTALFVWSPGGAVGGLGSSVTQTINMSPKGYHDAANCSVVEGWACDPNNYQQPLQIHFYQGGLAGRGGTYVGATTANISRADLQTVCGGNGGHGFSFSLPESLRTGSNQSIYAYAINIGAQGSNVLLTNSPKTVTCAPTPVNPTGYHDSANCSVVEGWACDPSNFQEPLQIHFYADNLAGSGTFVGATTANLSRADVASSCGGNGGHGFSFPLPPSLRTGTNRSIYAYAINTGVGSNVLLTQSPKTINCAVPPPNNITASCSTDSKNLTVSWDNAPGYDTVYFRVAPSSNTADGSLHVDNFYGNTRTTAITPGVPYSYWIHTSNGGTPSVAVSGTPITCAVPPPTNITTSCSEDGKNLTISWNNAPGYDTVYFRVAPSSNTADSSLYADNFYGNTRTTAITPGVPYSYWIHTSYRGTPSVAVGGLTITCNPPARAPATYPVTFSANGATGGTVPAAQTKVHDVNLTLPMNSGGLLRTGFTFTHWNTSADGTGTNYAMESLYTSNAPVTLYANWLKDASLCSAENAFIDCHLEMLQEK